MLKPISIVFFQPAEQGAKEGKTVDQNCQIMVSASLMKDKRFQTEFRPKIAILKR